MQFPIAKYFRINLIIYHVWYFQQFSCDNRALFAWKCFNEVMMAHRRRSNGPNGSLQNIQPPFQQSNSQFLWILSAVSTSTIFVPNMFSRIKFWDMAGQSRTLVPFQFTVTSLSISECVGANCPAEELIYWLVCVNVTQAAERHSYTRRTVKFPCKMINWERKFALIVPQSMTLPPPDLFRSSTRLSRYLMSLI